MEIICPEKEKAQRYAYAIWGLADKFARAKGEPMTLVLRDGKFIRKVQIAPEAIAVGNLTVDVQPQPLASGSELHMTYDLSQPPIGKSDVEELATLVNLLLRLETYFQEKG